MSLRFGIGACLFGACLVGACLAAGPGLAAPEPAPPDPATPAADPAVQPCGVRAARYGSKGFDLVVTRAGQVRVENPLRPLTPEVNHVLQVVIAGKVATAYGPDFAALRRGGAPAAVEGLLGAPIRWEAALPVLPDPIAIVGEDGAALADLAFRACEDRPKLKAPTQPPPQARRKAPARGEAAGAVKTPPGFSLPQGAIAE